MYNLKIYSSETSMLEELSLKEQAQLSEPTEGSSRLKGVTL